MTDFLDALENGFNLGCFVVFVMSITGVLITPWWEVILLFLSVKFLYIVAIKFYYWSKFK